jgi:hypothetical protein
MQHPYHHSLARMKANPDPQNDPHEPDRILVKLPRYRDKPCRGVTVRNCMVP